MTVNKLDEKPLVGIAMGSDSDWDVMKKAAAFLKEFGIPFDVTVASAHRTPELAGAYARSARQKGLKVIICGAGAAAHLAGAMAAHTTLPVIGVPIASSSLKGLDALLATVQMPAGVPVAAVAIDGARNAAILAAQILATGDTEIAARLEAFRKEMAEQVEQKSERLRERVSEEL